MKFEPNEIPHAANVCTGPELIQGEIIFDQDCIPWIVGNVNEQRRHNALIGVWYVPVRQAVYHAPREDDERGHIVPDKLICVREFKADETVEVYLADDLIEVIESDRYKYRNRVSSR